MTPAQAAGIEETQMTPEERKQFLRINEEWLSGKKIEGFRFLHNSTVRVTLPDGSSAIGSIVAATPGDKEPTYTVELADGTGDEECPESKIEAVADSN